MLVLFCIEKPCQRLLMHYDDWVSTEPADQEIRPCREAAVLLGLAQGVREGSALPEVKHPTPEVGDMLRVHLAEVAEVVLAHKVRRSPLHGLDVQLAMLQDEVLVLPPARAEPAHEVSWCNTSALHGQLSCAYMMTGASTPLLKHCRRVRHLNPSLCTSCGACILPEGSQMRLHAGLACEHGDR